MKWFRRLWRTRARQTPDVVAFMERLGSWETSDAYRDIDRYRDFRRVFGTDDGRRVLSQILAMCHVYEPSFLPDPDSNLVFVHEGERNIGLQILAIMNTEPE